MNWKTITAYTLAVVLAVLLLAGSVAYYVRLGEVLWSVPDRVEAVEKRLDTVELAEKADRADINKLTERVEKLEHRLGRGPGAIAP